MWKEESVGHRETLGYGRRRRRSNGRYMHMRKSVLDIGRIFSAWRLNMEEGEGG